MIYQYAVNEADNNDGEPYEGSFTSESISVWQYNLTVTAPDKADDGGDFVIDVDGGQPGGAITGEVGDGQGTITCDDKFDESGHAQCVVNPDDGYDGKIDITVEGPNGARDMLKPIPDLPTTARLLKYTCRALPGRQQRAA